MPVTLYRRQKQIVDFIAQYIKAKGHSPTLQEIANAMDLSSLATVHEHIATLVRKGVVKKYEGSVRGLEIIDPRYASTGADMELPVLGYIAAGKPIEPLPTLMPFWEFHLQWLVVRKDPLFCKLKANQ